MNDNDVIDALRATRRVSEDAVGEGINRQALVVLRDGIALTPRMSDSSPETRRRGRRLGRRGMAAGALGVALLGSGAAYAGYQQWYVNGGGLDGLTCMSVWQDPAGKLTNATGGSELTGDPVADCQHYQELTGKPAIADPVAFRLNGSLFVAPRHTLPEGAELVSPPGPDSAGGIALEASLGDWVDGGFSRCFDRASGAQFMTAEIDRLGLTGWTTRIMGPDPASEGPCGFFDVDPGTRTATFYPERGTDPNVRRPDRDVAGVVYDVRDALRTGIADKCVSTGDAAAVVKKALGSQEHAPTTIVDEPQAKCATVDMAVTGGFQIWIYGPAVARP